MKLLLLFTSSISATIKALSGMVMPSSDTSMSGAFRMQLTNNTNVAVKDIVLDVVIQTSYITGYTSASLSGGNTVWQVQGIS